MTHAELELEKLKVGFTDWAKHLDSDGYFGAKDAAELFWPFVEYIIQDPIQSAQKIALFNRFKASLGMELMAHERMGLE